MKTARIVFSYGMMVALTSFALVFGQPNGKVTLELKDGTVVKGRVFALSADDVTVESATGIITLKRSQLSIDSVVQLESAPPDELTDLREQIAKLERTIAALRAENQGLRALLGSQPSPTAPAQPAGRTANTAPQSSTSPGQALKFWLSSTGKRHNSNCRYFGVGNGMGCAAQDGTACKICGG